MEGVLAVPAGLSGAAIALVETSCGDGAGRDRRCQRMPRLGRTRVEGKKSGRRGRIGVTPEPEILRLR